MKTTKIFLHVQKNLWVRFAVIVLLVSCCHFAFANSFPKENKKTYSALKEKTQQWIRSHPIRFLENKGQMTDMAGKAVPFVLFKSESPGMSMYITEKGITYLFMQQEKEEHENDPLSFSDGEEPSLFSYQAGMKEDKNRKTEWERIDMELKGATIKRENIIKRTASVTDFNFFLSHCPDGIYGVKEYEKITIKEIYPGIDWVLYNAEDNGFKYDFVVHPGADPNQIKLLYRSKKNLHIDEKGNIQLKTRYGTLTENTPISYIPARSAGGQETKENIPTQFIKTKVNISNPTGSDKGYETQVSFNLETLNLKYETLIIDPQLTWATFYGGNSYDGPMSIDCDLSGNVFITGYAQSTNFPVLNPFGGAYFQGVHTSISDADAFILKFSTTGIRLWATYYGGGGTDVGNSICIDPNGNVLITGSCGSNFPVFNSGGAYFQGTYGGGTVWGDAFILKLSNTGVRIWATYYGGNRDEQGLSICTDLSGNVFVTGRTVSSNFPLLNPGGGAYFQGTYGGGTQSGGDAFILKFSNAGVRIWATYYGGNGDEEGLSICADPSGNVFVTGRTVSANFPVFNPLGGTYFQGSLTGFWNAFILKFSDVSVRIWATYYGGNMTEEGYSICTDPSGNIFVVGRTGSSNFPVLNPGGGTYFQGVYGGGPTDAFILKFNNTGVRLWSTFYGGSSTETFQSSDNIAIDHCGNIYISFETQSTNVPVQPDCSTGFYDDSFNGGFNDSFIVKFSKYGIRLWSTYLGGADRDFRQALAVNKNGNLFITGECGPLNTSSYPLTNPGGGAYFEGTVKSSEDGYIVMFTPPSLILSDTVTATGCGCTGTASITAAGGCSPYQYTWYNSSWTLIGATPGISNLCAGNYQVIVNDTTSCSIDTAFVTIPGIGSFSVTTSSTQTACGSNNGSATVNAGGGTPVYTYSWNPSGQTSQTATGLGAGNYTVTVTDANNCTSSQTVTVVSSGSITVTNQSASLCPGSTYTLPGGTIVSTGGTYNDTLTSVSGCDSIITTTLTEDSAFTTSQSANLCSGFTYTLPGGAVVSTGGIYNDTLTSTGGCDSIITTNLTVNPNPTATAFSNVTITQWQTATLTASGGGAYIWSNGINGSSITVTPPITTLYCVTVTDANNCTDTACVTVTIEQIDCSLAGTLYLPNAFSPNGDGENDKLQLYYGNLKCIKIFNLVIYNRWGEKVFETTNPIAEWDGYYKGKPEDTSVFAYYLEATLLSGENINKKGNVSLIR